MLIGSYLSWVSVALFVWPVHVHGTGGRQDDGGQQQLRPTRRTRSTDIKEKIIEWQCYAKCSPTKRFTNFETCKTQCKVDTMTAPRVGQCPNNVLELTFAAPTLTCLDECHVDFDCPDVQKCCAVPKSGGGGGVGGGGACGPVCMAAIVTKVDHQLPPIPKILHLKLPKGHKVEVTIQTSANLTMYYHVETRYHIGSQYSARKLSMWQWQPVEMTAEEILANKSKRIQICFNLKPGRWYQVRLAAINAYGFRGYSEPSRAFTLSKNPRPPLPPVDLQVMRAMSTGRYYTVRIAWCPSRSNLPIEKYKVIWSLYVKTKDESIISNEGFVRDAHQFEISKLLPDSSYYIQVLAMCISGRRRLKSDKISILFNTTASILSNGQLNCSPHANHRRFRPLKQLHTNEQQPPPPLYKDVQSARHGPAINASMFAYDVRFRLNRHYGMIVQISGLQTKKEKMYELCPIDTHCEHLKYSAIRAKKNSLEFSKLKFNTTYVLKTVQPGDGINGLISSTEKTNFSFKTPKCENFVKRFPKIQIRC